MLVRRKKMNTKTKMKLIMCGHWTILHDAIQIVKYFK